MPLPPRSCSNDGLMTDCVGTTSVQVAEVVVDDVEEEAVRVVVADTTDEVIDIEEAVV